MLTIDEIADKLRRIEVGSVVRFEKHRASDNSIREALLILTRIAKYYELRDQASHYSVKRIA